MAIDELASMAFGTIHYLYRVGTLCITIGLFLFVVTIFKDLHDFGVIPFRLILVGFGLLFWDSSTRKELKRCYGIAFLAGSVVPTRFFLIAYCYLR